MVRSTPAMTLVDAVTSRFSVRGFLPEPVPRDILEQVFELAQQSPSNCNTQPWKAFVASGELKERLRQKFLDRQQQGIPGTPDFGYNSGFAGEYRKRQVDCAVALYNEMGIARDDKDGRSWAVRRNFEFFDAPPHRLPRHVCSPGMRWCGSSLKRFGVRVQASQIVLNGVRHRKAFRCLAKLYAVTKARTWAFSASKSG